MDTVCASMKTIVGQVRSSLCLEHFKYMMLQRDAGYHGILRWVVCRTFFIGQSDTFCLEH